MVPDELKDRWRRVTAAVDEMNVVTGEISDFHTLDRLAEADLERLDELASAFDKASHAVSAALNTILSDARVLARPR